MQAEYPSLLPPQLPAHAAHAARNPLNRLSRMFGHHTNAPPLGEEGPPLMKTGEGSYSAVPPLARPSAPPLSRASSVFDPGTAPLLGRPSAMFGTAAPEHLQPMTLQRNSTRGGGGGSGMFTPVGGQYSGMFTPSGGQYTPAGGLSRVPSDHHMTVLVGIEEGSGGGASGGGGRSQRTTAALSGSGWESPSRRGSPPDSPVRPLAAGGGLSRLSTSPREAPPWGEGSLQQQAQRQFELQRQQQPPPAFTEQQQPQQQPPVGFRDLELGRREGSAQELLPAVSGSLGGRPPAAPSSSGRARRSSLDEGSLARGLALMAGGGAMSPTTQSRLARPAIVVPSARSDEAAGALAVTPSVMASPAGASAVTPAVTLTGASGAAGETASAVVPGNEIPLPSSSSSSSGGEGGSSRRQRRHLGAPGRQLGGGRGGDSVARRTMSRAAVLALPPLEDEEERGAGRGLGGSGGPSGSADSAEGGFADSAVTATPPDSQQQTGTHRGSPGVESGSVNLPRVAVRGSPPGSGERGVRGAASAAAIRASLLKQPLSDSD